MNDKRAGFTLIELLVVIGILALLIATFAPDILGARADAEKAADKANLRWHYMQIIRYKNKYSAWPKGSGHKFVLDPWVRGLVDATPANFDRYWSPGLRENDPYYQELKELDVLTLWKNKDDLSSEDTHYAGPSQEVRRARRPLDRGNQPLMANDNEFGAAFRDQSINVLMGDGTVTELFLDQHLQPLGYTGDGVEDWFQVGPESPHKMLQQLEK